MRSPLTVSAALVLSLTMALASPAAAQDELATLPAPSKVATHAGVTVYSERDPESGRYRLMVDTNSNGAAEAVPVDPRDVPFDVDLGPGEDGGVVAVYSRCENEPQVDRRSGGPHPVWSTARNCDLYRYDFRESQETRIDGPSTSTTTEVLPSIWRDEIAFVRVYHRRDGLRGRAPYLYVRTLEPGATSRRQPGGARGSSGVPGPMALDLVRHRLAFSWVYERDGGGVSEVRLDNVDGAHVKIVGEGWEDSVLRYVTPHLDDEGRLFYGEQRAMPRDEGSGVRSLGSRLWRYRSATGALGRADAPAQLFAAAHDRRSGVTVYGTTGDFLSATGCGGQPCRVLRPGDAPSFTRVRTIEQPERDCGSVAYTPNTDHGAFDITAEGTSCRVARQVARDAEGEPQTFRTRGFACTGRRREGAVLPSSRFTCRDGDRRVRFTRS